MYTVLVHVLLALPLSLVTSHPLVPDKLTYLLTLASCAHCKQNSSRVVARQQRSVCPYSCQPVSSQRDGVTTSSSLTVVRLSRLSHLGRHVLGTPLRGRALAAKPEVEMWQKYVESIS